MSAERSFEELLVPFARGELDPLEERWVASRLSPLERRRVEGFSAAVDWVRTTETHLEEAHRQRLVHRLNSMTPRRSIPPLAWSVFALALLTVLGFAVGWGVSERKYSVGPLVAERFSFDAAEVPVVELKRQARSAITPHLRAIVSENWQGRVDGDERETHVRVDRGQIAFGFRGGDGRRLEVSTEQARIVVTGTRFSVAVNDDGTETQVHVSQGRVEVWRGRRRVEIAAGDLARIDSTQVVVQRSQSAGLLDDPYLVAITELERFHFWRSQNENAMNEERTSITLRNGTAFSPSAPGGPKAAGRSIASENAVERSRRPLDFRGMGSVEPRFETSPSAAVEQRPSDLESELEQLEAADAEAKAGDLSTAVMRYQTLIAQAETRFVRQMARLGRARALGNDGQLRSALQELRALGAESGEIGRQARLSVCSVQRRFLPCAAVRCYEDLSEDSDRELATEALREVNRAERAGLRCDK